MAPTARDLLDRLRAATIHQSVDDLRGLYATDAVYEFPFAYPGVPTRFTGRDELIAWITAGWQADLPGYDRYRTHAIHDTADPNTIVVEQDAIGTSPATGEFALPNIMVLTVRNG
jgi:ketosteroid isomerase-like protein